MRVAIIHYWLVAMRGGERVLEQILDLYPQADIFTHVYDPTRMSAKIRERKVTTTFIGRLPFAKEQYQKYLPLMPHALELLDLSAYDLVISCEAGPAKGVITRPDALHVTYCHSPMRYIWDQYGQYRDAGGLLTRWTMPLLAPGLRRWDMVSASRSDAIMTNSHFVRKRVAKFWGREASVVYPPIDASLFAPAEPEDAYLWAGQLVPYKRPDLAVEAFRRNGLPLHIVGDGPMRAQLQRIASPNIRFTERLDFDALRKAYATARALVFTAEEDFGMIPVEVQASGRPVLAYGRGGALETVVEGRTGLFYREQTAAALEAAVATLEDWLPRFDPADAVAQAARFSVANFRAGFLATVARAHQQLNQSPVPAASLEAAA
ncbi:glycosyltransferase [Sphingomonas sp. HT-1]|uniref:glycosyltransferase n=1 Tax=unclassified Sphingomonas TaxID=196159 RepID=UPI0002FF02AC|nr:MULTISPECIES: glycosyltransferase [unclassified Sphingomonas]KTF68820.1 glycosyl transferase [Sphingomonas sp. WG]